LDIAARLRATWANPDLEVIGIAPFGDGHSGFTYKLDVVNGAGPYVLRLSAPGVRIAGPADVGRQGRIMAAVSAAGLPAPRVFDSSSEPLVDGRSFAVLELVEAMGWEEAVEATSHRAVAESAVAALKSLRRLPLSATGIGDEAVSSPAAELQRWGGLLERAPEFLHEPGRVLAARLEQTAPLSHSVGLVHGDLHYGNMLFSESEVIAIVDWEIAALSDPLLDLGCLAVASIRRKYPDEPNPAGAVEIPPGELVAMYGVEPEQAAWFIALSCLKYGAIMGYNLNLHRRGKRLDPVYEALQGTMRGLLEDGLVVLDGGLATL
jgi:aminoglycoside phosphotransferase (APT) family kinase protein